MGRYRSAAIGVARVTDADTDTDTGKPNPSKKGTVPFLKGLTLRRWALADQLKRAAQSVVLNIAEARGNDAGNARARFSTACGSAKEVRAALNVATDWGYIETHMATRLDGKLDEVCAITWCLGRRL